MQWMNRKQKKNGLLTRYGGRYYYNGTAMTLSILAMVVILLPLTAPAADYGEIEGNSGVLHVYGALTESACRLEMNSAWQDIWLGETGTGRLQQRGDQGEPVLFELRLKDCLRTPASNRDERTGALVWASNQPSVSVSFRAPSDMDNPQLVAVQGISISGLALRLTDSQGLNVRLGSRGVPLILTPGQSVLTYTVTPERTQASLMAGAYRATVYFRLNYD